MDVGIDDAGNPSGMVSSSISSIDGRFEFNINNIPQYYTRKSTYGNRIFIISNSSLACPPMLAHQRWASDGWVTRHYSPLPTHRFILVNISVDIYPPSFLPAGS